MQITIKKKDYIEKRLDKQDITYYTKEKIYRKKLNRKRDYIKDKVKLYEEKLYKKKTKLYKWKTI